MYYSKDMANVLPTEKQIAIIGSLCEGSSIRAIERMTGVHRDTVMRLGVRVGQGCTAMMSETLRDLNTTRLEMDEIWGFIGKKEKHVRPTDDPTTGDVWTFCAIDADTKLVPAFKVGKRTNATAEAFVQDVASRMHRVAPSRRWCPNLPSLRLSRNLDSRCTPLGRKAQTDPADSGKCSTIWFHA